MPRVRVIFSRRNSEKGMSIFHKNSGKGYNICKKFQIGSVILMTHMTNQKKTELIDFFDLVWTKNPQFLENFLNMEAIFSQNSPQNRTLETSIRHKNSVKGPTFSSIFFFFLLKTKFVHIIYKNSSQITYKYIFTWY